METAVIIIGMLAAFAAGAYIRKPFIREKREIREEIAEETAAEDKYIEQFNRLMSYNGKGKENCDE